MKLTNAFWNSDVGYNFTKVKWIGPFGFWYNGQYPNLAFHDQQLAFKWVQKYIHNFGGDPNKVTISGCSAGGQSVQNHLSKDLSADQSADCKWSMIIWFSNGIKRAVFQQSDNLVTTSNSTCH